MYSDIHYQDLLNVPDGTRVKVNGHNTKIKCKLGNKRDGIKDIKFENDIYVSASAYHHYTFKVLHLETLDKAVADFIEDVIDVAGSMWREDAEGGDEYLISRSKKLKEDLGMVKAKLDDIEG